MLTGSSQQTVGVSLALHEGGPVHQGLRSVPYYVTHWLLRVDPEQMLQDGQEGNLLGRVLHPVVHGVKHIEVTRQVHIMRPSCLSLITFTLLLKNIQLHLQVRVLAACFQVTDYLQQF